MDVNICPKCGSTGLKRRYYKHLKVRTPSDYFTCLDCGYESLCPIIDETDIEGFRQELKENRQ